MKKYTPSTNPTDVEHKWYVVDAEDQILGRLATTLAARLRGKHSPLYTPHVDTGDGIIVINAEKIRLTGRKWQQKTYYHHSGYMGGIKSITADKLLEKQPEELIRKAVKGMLPKNSLGRRIFKRLKVYTGDQHPHEAQEPQVLSL